MKMLSIVIKNDDFLWDFPKIFIWAIYIYIKVIKSMAMLKPGGDDVSSDGNNQEM